MPHITINHGKIYAFEVNGFSSDNSTEGKHLWALQIFQAYYHSVVRLSVKMTQRI